VVVSRTRRTGTATYRERVLVVTIAPVVVSTVARVVSPSGIVRHHDLLAS
jgi:hypothetical protein